MDKNKGRSFTKGNRLVDENGNIWPYFIKPFANVYIVEVQLWFKFGYVWAVGNLIMIELD